jgi:voltage-gated potassium channel
VVSPYIIGGHRMAQAALRPAVLDIIDLATHHQNVELLLEEIEVAPGSPLAGRSVAESQLRDRFGVVLAAVKRTTGAMVFAPSAEDRFETGDRLVVLAQPAQIRELERWVGGQR